MMTVDDVVEILAVVREMWPHSKVIADDPAVTARVWHGLLGQFDRRDVELAISGMAAAGREHAPPVGVIAHEVGLHAAGDAPSFEDAQRSLSRLMARCVPHDARSPMDTVTAVARFSAHGLHEAVLRFVAERGIYAVRMMPMGDEFGLDMGQQADRRDLARHYRDVTLPGWRADPSPGVALTKARRAAGLEPGTVHQIESARNHLRRSGDA